VAGSEPGGLKRSTSNPTRRRMVAHGARWCPAFRRRRAPGASNCACRFRVLCAMVCLRETEPCCARTISAAVPAVSVVSSLAVVPSYDSSEATIVELNMDKLEEILRRLEAKELGADDYETIKAVIGSYVYLVNVVGDKDTTIRRLRQMLFGAKTEKTTAVIGGVKGAEGGGGVAEAEAGPESSAATEAEASARTDAQASPRRIPRAISRHRAKAMAIMEPMPSPARKRSRCVTSHSSRAIPAQSANKARSTTLVARVCWCDW